MPAPLLPLSLALLSSQAPCAAEVVRVDLDAGVPGPRLTTPHGAPVLNGPFSARVEDGPPLAPGLLAIGFAENPTLLPAFGGAVLYPAVPFLSLSFALGADGVSPLLVAVPWLDPVLCGVELVLQAAVVDTAPGGASITNALRLRAGLALAPLLPATLFTTHGHSNDVAVAHIDGDGRPDLALPFSTQGSGVSVLLAAGTGFELAAPVTAGSSPLRLRAGDLDGDGFQDLVVHDAGPLGVAGGILTLLGHGDGAFDPPQGIAHGTGAFELGDLDGDGVEDLVIAKDGGLSIHTGAGDGTFGTAGQVVLGASPEALALVDLDGDGHLDLAAASPSILSTPDALHVLLGNGDATFQTASLAASVAGQLRAGDLDSDGNQDLVAADQLAVLLGNGDGTLDQPLPHGFGYRMALADVDGDGVLDLAAAQFLNDGDVEVRLGVGDGTLGAPETFAAGGEVVAVEVEDVGADGARDLVVALQSAGPSGAAVLPGDGAGGFAALVNLSLAAVTGLETVVLADVTEDGKLDLVGASGGTAHAFVIPGDGTGGFGTPAEYDPGFEKSAQDVAVGDLNADGVRDLATANFTAADVSVFLGAGGGAFGAPQVFPTGIYSSEILAADLDGDGLDDLATVSYLQNYVSVLRASGPAAFLAPIVTWTGSVAPRSLAIADVDQDGVLDFGTANWWTKDVSVLLGKGDGTFQTPLVVPVGDLPWALAFAELDADGVVDAAVTDQNLGLVSVLHGNGDGTFAPGAILSAGEFPSSIAVRDLDGDGRPELVTTGTWQGLTLFRGLGGGAFGPGESYALGGHAVEVATGDVDGDGLHDVAVGLTSDNDVAVLINTVGEEP